MHLMVGKISPIPKYVLGHDYYTPIVRHTIFGTVAGDGVKLGEFLSHTS